MGQKVYVNALCGLLPGNGYQVNRYHKDNTDINSMVYYQLKNLRYKLSIKNSSDPLESAHNDYLVRLSTRPSIRCSMHRLLKKSSHFYRQMSDGPMLSNYRGSYFV